MPEKLIRYKKGENLRILFTRSGGYFNSLNFPDQPMIGPPKSLLYLAGAVKSDPEIEMKLLDLLANPDLKKLKTEKKNPPFYFGMDIKEALTEIENFQPHIIAVTASANYYFHDTTFLINEIRKKLSSVFIVVGGSDPTNDYPAYFEKSKGIDVIVLKEGEITFRNLVSCLKSGKNWKKLDGIAWLQDGKIVVQEHKKFVQNLDELYCDYSLVDFKKYFDLNKKGFHSRLTYNVSFPENSIDIITSRGCSYGCTFCSIHLHLGNKMRAHSTEYVLKEMKILIEDYNVRNFHFEDDNLLFDRERFKNILRGIIQKKWKITWDTPNGVRADLVDEELLKLCRMTGCTYLAFGIESGSKKVLDTIIYKKQNLADVVRACELCYKNEIDSLAFFIFGLPGETREDLLKTYYFAFDLFKNYNTAPIFQLWRPYRNTELEEKVRDTENITQPVVFTLHKKHRIPYTMFYTSVYEDDEVTIEFLAYYFEKYIRDAIRVGFSNWFRIMARNPLRLIGTLLEVFFMIIRSLFHPEGRRYLLEQYVSSLGLLPFSRLRRRGKI